MGRWVGGEWAGPFDLLAKNDNAVPLDSHRQPIQHVPLETGT